MEVDSLESEIIELVLLYVELLYLCWRKSLRLNLWMLFILPLEDVNP